MALAKIRPASVVEGVSAPATRPRSRPTVRAAWRALGLSRAELREEASPVWAIGVPVGVMALIILGAMLEPAPAVEATGGMAVLEAAIGYVLIGGLALSLMGAMTLRRWGIGASLAVALVSLGVVVSCPASGHHTFGMWFGGELALVAAAAGAGIMGLLRTKQ